MSNLRSFVTSATVALFAVFVPLFTACGGGVNDNESLAEIDETQAQTLCEDLETTETCTYESDGSEIEVDPPSDCETYSERVTSADEQSCEDVTVGDARDCHNACGENSEACSAYTECIATGSVSEDDASSDDSSE